MVLQVGQFVYMWHYDKGTGSTSDARATPRKRARPLKSKERPWIGRIERIIQIKDGYHAVGLDELGRHLILVRRTYFCMFSLM
jgi:hypothetical protein